ncbi:hypothetical protein DOY81_001271, partial [Sarcophaga bullata]
KVYVNVNMSTLMALRHLGKFLANANTIKNHGCLFRLPLSKMPATQYFNTKLQMATNSPASHVNNNYNDDWRIIYRLDLIRLASAFNRVKIPYGFLNGITVPGAFALEQASHLPPSTSLLIAIVGLSSWCTLAICSFFVRNLVGIIYINDTGDKLKLAYVDYWGKRQDACIDLNDLIPESEKAKPSKFDFYQTLCLYSDNKIKYKLLQRFGSIEDHRRFHSSNGIKHRRFHSSNGIKRI